VVNNIHIARMTVADWEVYKEIRLASLLDTPEAFGSTFEREIAFEKERWIQRLDTAGREDVSFPVMARINDKACGLASGLADESDAGIAHVYQMWVAPEFRQLGIGKGLLNHIIDWAKQVGFMSLVLAVNPKNNEAKKLYLSAGFIEQGELEPLRPDSNLTAQNMVLGLQNV
jgi:ribosomal protein S18 acetylase RimI-like enzyme